MPKEFDRSRRVQALIQRQLADIIRSEVKDPRVGPVSIPDVRVSKDLTHARVYISDLDADAARRSVEALNRASGFIRRLLKDRVSMRNVPELQFVYDESIERGTKLYSLIEKTAAADRERGDESGAEEE